MSGMIYDSSANPVNGVQGNTDNVPVNTDGLATTTLNLGFNGSAWERLRTSSVAGDAVTPPTTGVLTTSGFNYVFNGATWDRWVSANAMMNGMSGKGMAANVIMLYNGSTYDFQYNNVDASSVQAATTKTSSFATATQTNYNHRGAVFTIVVASIGGTSPTIAVNLADKNGVNLTTASTNITANGTYKYIVYPGGGFTNTSTAVVGTASVPLPRQFQLYFTIGGTTPTANITVTADYML